MKSKFQKRIFTVCQVGVCTAIIAISSYISIPMTLPITMQNLAVMLISGLFGLKIGLFSTLAYILLGIAGLPIFSGAQAGLSAIFGMSGGFILGFIIVSIFVGAASDLMYKRGKSSFKIRFFIMLSANVLLYACGVLFYCFIYANGDGVTVVSAIALLVLPYVVPDLIKTILAAYLSKRLSFLKNT